MKYLITSIILVISFNIYSQNINGKLGSSGQFIIRDTSSTFLTLPQNTGYLNLNRSLVLPNTTDNTTGVIYKGVDRFIHNYQATGTSGQNVFIGINSGNFTMSGTSLNASRNSALGNLSLSSLTTGSSNSALGYNSLYLNTIGSYNSAFGETSLRNNTTGSNNAAFGSSSLFSNTTGNNNSSFGDLSLTINTTGENNSAFGNNSGSNITTGSNNTCIGKDAIVPSGTANNQVRIGNTSVTYAGIQVAWTITSDRNLKKNILSSNLGLGFISRLRPVSYIRKNDESEKTEYGLIAQEVEETLKQEGVENAGMLTVTDKGEYQLRYNDLLAPMIKAIQELNEENQNLKAANQNLEERMAKFEQLQSIMMNEIENIKSPGSENKIVRAGK